MHLTRSRLIGFATILTLGALVAAQLPVEARGEFSDPLDALGIERFECRCSQSRESGSTGWFWLFQSEPTIGALDPDGPSHGKLRPGDVIVAVDGRLITTRSGGERFSKLTPGETVELTVRRDGVEYRERIVPREPAELAETSELGRQEESLTLNLAELSESLAELARIAPELERLSELGALSELSELAELEELGELPGLSALGELAELGELSELSNLGELAELGELSRLSGLSKALGGLSVLGDLKFDLRPLGWFGVGLSFSGSLLQRPHEDQPPRWKFDAAPKVNSVDPDGPAARAGVRNGDVLTHIDGARLDSDEGGTRFSDVQPGQTVTWTVRRHGTTLTIPVTAEERPQ